MAPVYFTAYLTNLNTDLNQVNTFRTLWDTLLLSQYVGHPLNAHKMTQVIFGFLGQDLFGY